MATPKTTLNVNDPATPALIPAMIEDMGIGEADPTGESVKATEEYMREIITETGDLDIGTTIVAGQHFFEGYQTCIQAVANRLG